MAAYLLLIVVSSEMDFHFLLQSRADVRVELDFSRSYVFDGFLFFECFVNKSARGVSIFNAYGFGMMCV